MISNHMKKLFGTDGIRGEAGKHPLNEEVVKVIGRSIARQFKGKKEGILRFLTGRDTRESGERIESVLHSGAAYEGVGCLSSGVMTTPGVAYLTKKHAFDAGIVISASHNPYWDNGIKIFLPSGEKLDKETEKRIENDVETREHFPAPEVSVEASKSDSFRNDYLDHLTCKFKRLSLTEMKLVVDCANGAASNLAPRLFESFGANVVSINDRPNGKNINKDSGPLHLELLRPRVIKEKADFGVAFDGDADRALFVDEKGGFVDGDAILWIMARHLKKKGKLENNMVVATVMSNIGLEAALRSLDIDLIRTNVGDKHVLRELQKTGASIGGEQSGHIIFPFLSLSGDGMQTTLFLLEALRESKRTLSEMKVGFTQFPQVLVNVKVREKRPFDEVFKISEKVREIERVLGKNGRLLLRYSGTENLARVMIEGTDRFEIESQANNLSEVISKSLN